VQPSITCSLMRKLRRRCSRLRLRTIILESDFWLGIALVGARRKTGNAAKSCNWYEEFVIEPSHSVYSIIDQPLTGLESAAKFV
jgi:hypothetical protein